MNKTSLIMIALLLGFVQCKHMEHSGEPHEDHEEEAGIQYTQYSDRFELFAESEALVVGKACAVLAHFTHLENFKPLTDGPVLVSLTVSGQTVSTKLPEPSRPGIFAITLTPKHSGKGELRFLLPGAEDDPIIITDVHVFASEAEASEHEDHAEENPLAVTFTKEQSWKVDFATRKPEVADFGQTIRGTARIQSTQDDEIIIAAKSSGVVRFSEFQLLIGQNLKAGQALFSVTGGDITENNLLVRYSEARNNYLRLKSDLERIRTLAKDRIVAQKELLQIQNEYDNARALYENLDKHFGSGGQMVRSPTGGFIKQIMIANGQYVNAGQPVMTVSQKKTLLLQVDVRQKYAVHLPFIVSATIRSVHSQSTYTLEQLNGRILSFGQSVNEDNFMVPVSLQIDNTVGLMPGSFVDVILKTAPEETRLTVPNSAILENQGKYYLFVQINPERFEKREVKIGADDAKNTVVLEGIAADDRVVSKGAVWVKLAQASGTLDAHSGHVH